ncbi:MULTISPECIES: VanW family protein [unclassified Novosphingobium]|uniref:VanW family protein n=1 Tax=unclassified Novosphingobium TaxID=2644732 RepID=UPI0025ED5722|nr:MULTISPECIES: VanW family protein [unclassified Novosphingobium]HQV03960.1 VanW family protein [Novosphingobium sp.]
MGLTITIRMALRRMVPEAPRRALALARRGLRDRSDGTARRFAARRADSPDWPTLVELEQPIRQGPFWEGKLINLQLGSALVDGVVIAPGQVLSFWALVDRPDPGRGFAMGRGIRANAEQGDIGGGLCQLAGIIYELGLRSGLHIAERHPHSRDLYLTEAERFTQLGLDATVVWPWKDLRLENRSAQAVALILAVDGLVLRARLLAAQPVALPRIEIERHDHADQRLVTVRRDSELVSHDSYAIGSRQ